MDNSWWFKQTKAKPLFPELEWSRPENKAYAGKLVVIGGNAQGFTAPAEAFSVAVKTGIGSARVILPNVLTKTVLQIFPEAEFVPSTPSGSFATKALGEILPACVWADGVLLAGDFGRNSETAILLETLVSKYEGALTLTKDALDYFTKNPLPLLQRPETLLVGSLSQLQQIGIAARLTTPITFSMDAIRLASALRDITLQYPSYIITKHLDLLFCAVAGKVSTTPSSSDEKIWRLKTASAASVWWLQNPAKPFDAITASLVF